MSTTVDTDVSSAPVIATPPSSRSRVLYNDAQAASGQ